MEELKEQHETILTRLEKLSEALDFEEAKKSLAGIEKKMAMPDFWNDQEEAQAQVAKLKELKTFVDPLADAWKSVEDAKLMLEMLEDDECRETINELKKELDVLSRKLERFEFLRTMSGKDDKKDVFLSVQAGAGGTDSCDFAAMLVRMYRMYLEDKGFELSLISQDEHDEAGVKSATIKVSGPYAYGFLKSEIGVHRLIRLSPFDFNERRHTSFASVDVVPVYDEEINIEINDSDLRIDTYRSSGAGGQHVNVTDSAVRITHLPTGIVVACQNERSQHHNRTVAMQLLKARLYRIEKQKREDELKNLYGEKGEIAWGNQIRTYTLHPYTLVKDHRTGVETSSVDAVLNGDIEQFIEAYLRTTIKKQE